MNRFSLKDVFRGITLAAIGFGMLGMASDSATKPATFAHAFLVAFGGVMLGYGLSFSIKYPPTRMMAAMIGMFAAEAWDDGSSVGLIVYVGGLAAYGGLRLAQHLTAKRRKRDDWLSAASERDEKL